MSPRTAPASLVKERPACPLCGDRRSRRFPIYYEFNGTTFQGAECGACSFIYLSPRPTPADLDLMYSEEYFTADNAEHGAHSSTDYETAAIRGSVKFPAILGWIQKYRPSGDLLEIGCGMGYFLDFARRNGYRVSGIEYSRFAAETARSRFGLDVQVGSLDRLVLPSSSYDVVFMGDVLEHMVEPVLELERVRRLLKPGGIVAVELPSQFNSLVGRLAIQLYRLTGKERFMRLPPYHVNEFMPGTARAILLKSGYSNVRVIERIKPPSTITLRGSLLDKVTKKALQYPNYWLTRSFKILGDRLLAIGTC